MKSIYHQTESAFLQRLNPLSKILAPLPIFCFVALTTAPWLPFLCIVLTVAVILALGRVPVQSFLKVAGPIFLFLLTFVIIYPLLVRAELVNSSPLWLELGNVKIYQAGVLYGVATALRIYALILFSLLFTFTTEAGDFIRALVQQWKLPYKLGYGTLASFRFMTLLQNELRLIRAAHKIRGVADRGGVRGYYNRMKRYSIPLLATAIRQAERTALAMDGRAFGAFEQRTYYRQYRFQRRDYFFVSLFWVVSGGVVTLLWWLDWLGPLVFLQQV